MTTALAKRAFYPWAPSFADAPVGSGVNPEQAASRMFNVTPTEHGTTEVRGGYRAVLSRSSEIDSAVQEIAGIYVGRFADKSNREFLVYSTNSVETSGIGDRYFIRHWVRSSSGVFLDGSSEEDLPIQIGAYGTTPDYIVVESTLYITNPGTSIVSYGSKGSYRPLVDIPSCHYLSYNKSRLFCGRLKGAPDSVAYSRPGAHEDFDLARGAGRIRVSQRSGDPVTGIFTFFGDTFVMTRNTLSILNPDVSLDQISGTIGGFHHSGAQVGNDFWWASTRGVHSLAQTHKHGDVEQSFVSAGIQDYWKRYDPKMVELAWATYYPQKQLYLLAMRGKARPGMMAPGDNGLGHAEYGAQHNEILVCHVPSRRWSVWDWPATCIAMTEDLYAPGRPVPICGGGGIDDEPLSVGILDTGDHFDITGAIKGRQYQYIDGATRRFTARIETQAIDLGDPSTNKSFREIRLFFKSGAQANATLYWMVDDQYTVANETQEWQSEAFLLNPENLSDEGSGNFGGAHFGSHNTSSQGSVFPDPDSVDSTVFLGGQTDKVHQKTIQLKGSGRRIRFALESTTGHFLDFFGFDLVYLVEGITRHEIGRASDFDERTDTPTWSDPPAARGSGGGMEVPDEALIP